MNLDKITQDRFPTIRLEILERCTGQMYRVRPADRSARKKLNRSAKRAQLLTHSVNVQPPLFLISPFNEQNRNPYGSTQRPT